MSAANDSPFGVLMAAATVAILTLLILGIVGGRFVLDFYPDFYYLVGPVSFASSALFGALAGIGVHRRIQKSKRNGTFMPMPW